MTYPVTIQLNRGSDLDCVFVWPDGDGLLDLSAYTVSVIDVTAGIVGAVTAAITDAAAGEITVSIEGGSPLLPLGLHGFRVKITDAGGDDLSTPMIGVNVQ